MTWWTRHRRNLLSLAALLGLVPLAVWVTLGDISFLREQRPRVPVEAGADGTVTYAGADLGLISFAALESLPTDEGTWRPPPGYRLWAATLSVALEDLEAPLDLCEVRLADRNGTLVDSGTLELSQATGRSSFTSCEPADVEFDAPRPPSYEIELPFLTAASFTPESVRVVVPDELPRYASFPVSASAGG